LGLIKVYFLSQSDFRISEDLILFYWSGSSILSIILLSLEENLGEDSGNKFFLFDLSIFF
jgi:hypothetical protein